jgi:hypothetical protein
MISGKMNCLGSSQHLKSKFGSGYQVEVRGERDCSDETLRLLQELLPSLQVEERHGIFLRIKTSNEIDLARVFDFFESNKERLKIFDYSVSQCSLEQIFINFAKEQEEEVGLLDRIGAVAPQAEQHNM